jgi:phosphate-selective porin OprO/OprP
LVFSISEKMKISVPHSKSLGFAMLFLFFLHHSPMTDHIDAASHESEDPYSNIGRRFLDKAKKGMTGPLAGTHYYWDKGLHIENRKKNVKLKIGGKLQLDYGGIHTNSELESAFPDFEGHNVNLRRLSADFSGVFFEDWELKLEIDFSDMRVIRDNWIGLRNLPIINRFRVGHMKEPLSLETQTSAMNLTFMEKSLPVSAFSLGRNIGFRVENIALDGFMTWAVGGFWNTGSLKDVSDAADQVTDANGFNLTGRVNYVPLCVGDGRALVNLGLSYSHGFRDENEADRFNPLPETTLMGESLVDTGEFFGDSLDLINPEVAVVAGPLFFQGEYFHVFAGANEVGNPQFWGWYAHMSYFLTGDHRRYNASNGTFSRVVPKHNFHPLSGESGSWELGLRYSFVDLNDEGIKGGKERNITLGLNGYLNSNIRFQFNYINAKVEDRADPQVEDGRADIVQARFQIGF